MSNPTPSISSSERFSAELLPGEHLAWSGRPNPSVIFHREDFVAIPLSLLWGGFAIFWFLGASGLLQMGSKTSDTSFSWFGIVGTPFVVIGQYLIWGRFFYSRWQKKRTDFLLTDHRAIVLRSVFGRRCTSASFENLAMIDKRVRTDGIGSISFGGPLQADWQWGRGNRTPRPLTFDDVDGADTVYKLATQLLARRQIAVARDSG